MKPLAERMRPDNLEAFIGQDHLVGSEGVLRKVLERGELPSMIFWGPPGVGKTTLAKIVTNQLNRSYFNLSAINSGVKEIREIIKKAERTDIFHKGGAILFIDEIHRFNKGQQDALLGAVEDGTITLIGATTENPSFEVNSALLSRCQVYVLHHLDDEEVLKVIHNAIERDSYLKNLKIRILETSSLLKYAAGDARKALSVLDILVRSQSEKEELDITDKLVKESIQNNLVLFDKSGDQHYDIASAMIKSIRGSDPNAAVYYLARMLSGGEDVNFIARRLMISASEDIGLANPNALLLATSAAEAVHRVGMPESRIILSQVAIYLASSAKSNSAYMAINKGMQLVQETGNLSVPLHLRNAPTRLMKSFGYGDGYQYAHDYENNFVDQEFMPDRISESTLYDPGDNHSEKRIRTNLQSKWKTKYGY
ncbi:MAG: replication-associated recombination protein A [Bacteroidia bacterium]|nr:replication-associated recombination protein A [Bacteroidia bacterium]